jgi:hypothetical protein
MNRWPAIGLYYLSYREFGLEVYRHLLHMLILYGFVIYIYAHLCSDSVCAGSERRIDSSGACPNFAPAATI